MTDPRMTGNKTCTRCNRPLPVICFPVDKKTGDGLSYWCRECVRNQKREGHCPNRANKKAMMRGYVKLGQNEETKRGK